MKSRGGCCRRCAGEEEWVLQDDAEAAAKRSEVLVADVDAVDQDLAALHVVEAHHQRGDGGLAGAGVADDGGGFSGAMVKETPRRIHSMSARSVRRTLVGCGENGLLLVAGRVAGR